MKTKIVAGVKVPENLYKFGLSSSYPNLELDENFNLDVIEKCIPAIDVYLAKSNSRKKYSSYQIKHWLEKGIGQYVSNGEAIVALIASGYKLDFPKDKRNPNPIFNLVLRQNVLSPS